MRESLYTRVIKTLNTILNSKTILILGRFRQAKKVPAWYIEPHGIENKSFVKCPYPTGIKKHAMGLHAQS